MCFYTMHHLSMLSLTVPLIVGSYLFRMLFFASSRPLVYQLSIIVTVFSLLFSSLFTVFKAVLPIIFQFFLSMFLSILQRIQPILFSMFVSILLFAFSALCIKPIFLGFIAGKELRGSGVPLLAFRTVKALLEVCVLRYSVFHDGNQSFLSSRSGVFQHCLSTTLLPLDYTTNPLHKQLYPTLLGGEICLS